MKVEEDSPERTAGQYAWVLCATNKVADFDKIMAMRAKWMQARGWDEGDFVYLAATANRHTYRDQDVRKLTSLLQISDGMIATQLIELDALGARTTMFSRFFAVTNCLADEGYGARTLLRKIMCTREQLDPAKAYAEIDKVADLNHGTRFKLRTLVRETAAKADKARAEVQAKAKEDPAIAKVIAIADEQVKEWASPSPVRAKLVQQLEALEAAERANKSSAFAGCDVTTRANWEEHLKGLTIPKVATEDVLNVFIRATLGTAEGYLAYQALRLCAANSGTATTRHDFMGTDVLRRGPRTGTLAAWFSVAGGIKFDDRGLKDLWAQISASYLTSSQNRGYRQQKPIQGVIAGVNENDGNIEISFKTVIEKREDCLKWHEGTQIVQYRLDGSPIYRRDCVKWGMVDMDLTADSIRLSKVLAHGLKPGMFLVGVEDFGIAATATPKSAKAVWVFGGSLK